ncbi:MAG: anhydro-N-acetylmuramic acid kinase [Methylovulum sp.]|uniref:anhydro-N-acetylmuramic acid kinase n=1 Tax=Methylovulum sp. TaxID=1916980 RepID=UPI00262A852D|nr:anhydro-N-acetylmuramic acid kinase [Methylovulum sp.]MDD2723796.1 anhydro-N-acetylmuramic acid kinase [Methylovulum sp.]MDD5123653.1 anhydro-N-acetylmuramic acid kinase [Methylovulum sp.]
MPELYIGLMAGTSIDGIDAALVDFSNDQIQLIAFEYLPFPDVVKSAIAQISTANALISLTDYGRLDRQLGGLFADTVKTLLNKAGLSASAVEAIGSHGQTVYHAPDGDAPFSLQIGDPNVIVEQTGITTVADFRRRDLAVNGQGAPLVPAFHQAVFGATGNPRCIVNIGGIANITVLPGDTANPVIGFDTGPGNTLMDLWIYQHTGKLYDADGTWARSGHIQAGLVEKWRQDAYFHAAPPKSTGKEYFSLPWLAQTAELADYRPEDIQASLCALTAATISDAIKQYAPDTRQVIICGGGAHNGYLLELLAQHLPCPVQSSEGFGMHPDHVEAMAFAWLARQTLLHLPGNLKEVTGADKSVVLGGIYRAG